MNSQEIDLFFRNKNWEVEYSDIEYVKEQSKLLKQIKFEGIEGDRAKYFIMTWGEEYWWVYIKCIC